MGHLLPEQILSSIIPPAVLRLLLSQERPRQRHHPPHERPTQKQVHDEDRNSAFSAFANPAPSFESVGRERGSAELQPSLTRAVLVAA